MPIVSIKVMLELPLLEAYSPDGVIVVCGHTVTKQHIKTSGRAGWKVCISVLLQTRDPSM